MLDAGIIQPLLDILKKGNIDEIKNEAAYAICNGIANASKEQLLIMFGQGVVDSLLSMITPDLNALDVILEALEIVSFSFFLFAFGLFIHSSYL